MELWGIASRLRGKFDAEFSNGFTDGGQELFNIGGENVADISDPKRVGLANFAWVDHEPAGLHCGVQLFKSEGGGVGPNEGSDDGRVEFAG